VHWIEWIYEKKEKVSIKQLSRTSGSRRGDEICNIKFGGSMKIGCGGRKARKIGD
jgi:hypothetical protein